MEFNQSSLKKNSLTLNNLLSRISLRMLSSVPYIFILSALLLSLSSCALFKQIEDGKTKKLLSFEQKKSKLLQATAEVVKYERGDKYKTLDLSLIAKELENIELGKEPSLVSDDGDFNSLVERLEVPEVSSGIDDLVEKTKNTSSASRKQLSSSTSEDNLDMEKLDTVLQARLDRDEELAKDLENNELGGEELKAELLTAKAKKELKNLTGEIEEVEKSGLRGLGDKEDSKSPAEIALAALEKKQNSNSLKNKPKPAKVKKDVSDSKAADSGEKKADERASLSKNSPESKVESEVIASNDKKEAKALNSLVKSSKASKKSNEGAVKNEDPNKIPVWVFLLMAASLSIAGFGLLWVSKNN